MTFQEEQRFNQRWLWILIILTDIIPFIVIAFFLAKAAAAANWAIGPLLGFLAFVVFAVGLPLFIRWTKLITEVRNEGIYIRFVPFIRRRLIPYDQIQSCEARACSPIGEYGGWGIRWGPSGKAYNMSGNRGVQLVFKDGKRLLIGSQRADELAAAIKERMATSS